MAADAPAPALVELLRPGLLDGVSLLIAGASGESAVGSTASALGARVALCAAPEDDALDQAIAAAVAPTGTLDALVVEGGGLFAAALGSGGDGHAALRACADGAWNATRAVVNGAFLKQIESTVGDADGQQRMAGRIVYLAPRPDAGTYTEAARAGLENLARTLSIEWARHRITTVAIAPGAATAADEVAALVAYLASAAGAYFSGCQLDLRGER